MNIVLLGYMTSGKTTVGKILQEKTHLTWLDLDVEIEKKENQSINQIFEKKGEIYFRKIEREVLLELLEKDNVILSLGGGTPCYYNNIEEINKKSISFYLQTSITELVKRIQLFSANRPLVKDRTEDELKEFVAKHLFERNTFYQQAHFTIYTDQKSFDQLALEILLNTEKK